MNRCRRCHPVAILLVLVGVVAARAAAQEMPQCTSTAGNCTTESFNDYGTYTETEVMVHQLEGATSFLTTLDYPQGRSLTVDWARPADPAAECTGERTCENGEHIECFREGPAHCGDNGFAVWCGSFQPANRWFPGGSLEATVLTCRGLADPWPDLPAPKPAPKPKPKPGPGPGPNPPPQPLPEEGCTPARIRQVNSVDRGYVNNMFARTVAPDNFRSEMVVRHVPGRTSMRGQVFADDGVENHEAVLIDDTMYWHSPAGPWLAIPGEIRRRMGAHAPGDTGVDHSLYGPANMVRAFQDDAVEYYGVGPCEGTLDAGAACFHYGFKDDGEENSAYFAADDCLLVSVVGADKNGPRSFVIEYPGEVEVPDPDGEVVTLTGDPAVDMPKMMQLIQPGQ